MKHFVAGSVQGNTVVLVEWDADAGTMAVAIFDPTGARLEYDNLHITHGLVDQGEIYWHGPAFSVTKFHHQELVAKFPTIDVDEQYVMANEWCVRKAKEIKNSYQFMTNWLKKARGGNAAAGGVVY